MKTQAGTEATGSGRTDEARAPLSFDLAAIDFAKGGGLVPAVIQDSMTRDVLMLGYMNRAAFEQTLNTGKVTFFSRSRQALWVKGESSGNFLYLCAARLDCDGDTLLIAARPHGPTCHTGAPTCFGARPSSQGGLAFLEDLAAIIAQRRADAPQDSYVAKLFAKGRKKIAQKVGEEGMEVALAHLLQDRHETLEESADLMFHLLVLLEEAGLSLSDVGERLRERHAAS